MCPHPHPHPQWAQQGDLHSAQPGFHRKSLPCQVQHSSSFCPDPLSQALHTAHKQPVVTTSPGGPVLKRGTVGALML